MNVLVTGTARGIGRAIAERYLAADHRVWGIDVRASSLVHERYTHVLCDIRDGELPEVPQLQILVNNAGTLEEADALDINLEATIRVAKHYAESPALRSVLFIASASARNGAEFPLYVASKAGVVGYMKNLALQLAPRGITCNSISPGGVNTESNEHIVASKELYQAVLDETLLGKWAEPEEVAELAYYLTVVNRSITGEDILMDNGEMLKSNFIW